MSAIPPPPPPPSEPPPSLPPSYQKSRPAPPATKPAGSGEDLLSQLQSGKKLKKTPVNTNQKSVSPEPKSKPPASKKPQIKAAPMYKPNNNDSSDGLANEPVIKTNSSKLPAIPASLPPKPSTLNQTKSGQGPRLPPLPSKPNDQPLPNPRTANMNQSTNPNSSSMNNVDENQEARVPPPLQRKPVPPSPAKNRGSEDSITPKNPPMSPPQTPPRIKAKTLRKNHNESRSGSDTGIGTVLNNSDRQLPPPVPSAPIPTLRVSRNTSQGTHNLGMSSFYPARSEGIPQEATMSKALMSKMNTNDRSTKKSLRASTAVDSSANTSSTDLFKSRFKFPSDIAPPSSFVNFPKVYASKLYQQSRQN